jgi:hypothetical protein
MQIQSPTREFFASKFGCQQQLQVLPFFIAFWGKERELSNTVSTDTPDILSQSKDIIADACLADNSKL